FHILYNEIWKQHLFAESTSFIIYYNDPFTTSNQKLRWEVGRPLYKKTPVHAPLTVKKWNYGLHVSKTIPGDSDKEAREEAIEHMRTWIHDHDYVDCGPLMVRFIQAPIIEGKFRTERIELLIPIEKVK
ncbi:MAG: hypothetical protein P8107_14255, partial [Spirochaetia bacterium]